MRKGRIIAIVLCVFSVFASSSAQVGPYANWSMVRSLREEFTIAVPPSIDVFSDKEGFSKVTLLGKGMNSGRTGILYINYKDAKHITSFIDGVTISVSRYETINDQFALELYSRPFTRDSEVSELTGEGFKAKVISKTGDGWYFIQVIAYCKDTIFHIRAGTEDRENNTLKFFLNSLEIKGSKLFSLKPSVKPVIDRPIAELTSLADTNLESASIDDRSKFLSDDIGTYSQLVLPNFLTGLPDEFNNKAISRDRALHIVPLRITFSSAGRVSRVELFHKDPLSRVGKRAISAARLIRFLPPKIDGKNSDVTLNIEYRTIQK